MTTKILTTSLALIISGTMVFAQSKTKKSIAAKTEQDSIYYICPIHPDLKTSGEGKCNTCNANLEQKTTQACDVKPEKTEPPKICVCPMHPGVQSHKSGKCPDCGADLVEKKKK